jgi:hypothetical protein
MTEAVMARKKSAGKKSPSPALNKRLSVQACEEWLAWVEKGADYIRTDVSKLVDMALTNYLRAQGFTEPPPKRTP